MQEVSFWEENSFYIPRDFIIIGAGLAGLWTALELKTKFPSATVLIIERGSIPTGASTRNAGFACFGSPTEMISDAATMGEDLMWSVVEMRYKGIEKIRSLFGATEIDYDPCGGYECFGINDPKIKIVEDQLEWLNKGMERITRIANTFNWCDHLINDFGFAGFERMIENKSEGGLHPGKLVKALLQKVMQAGVDVLFGMQVAHWEKINGKISIRANAKVFNCTTLILATNAFLPKLLKEECVTPARGQVIVTEPIEGLRLSGTFHYDEGYYYFRNIGNRILLGGARNTDFETEATDELSISENIQQTLEAFLSRHLLPCSSPVVMHRWSGIMAFSKNKLPYIRQVETNVYALSACNGMGVALTPIAATALAEQLAGTFNEKHIASSLLLSQSL